MKVGDKVWDRSLCRSGTILKEPYYRVAELYKEELDGCIQVMSLHCTVDVEGMGAVVCSLEDLELYETPQIVEYQLVQISMHARMYWGMTGTVVDVIDYGALVDYGVLVKLDGYDRLSNSNWTILNLFPMTLFYWAGWIHYYLSRNINKVLSEVW